MHDPARAQLYVPAPMQSPAVQVCVLRSSFLACAFGLFWLLPVLLLLLRWTQGAVLTEHLLWALAYFSTIGVGLFWFYTHLFLGNMIWNGSAWLLQTALHNPSLVIGLQSIWIGQNHFLLRAKPVKPAKSYWIWIDASMCNTGQWLALRRVLFARSALTSL